jgi:hypothetical protein
MNKKIFSTNTDSIRQQIFNRINKNDFNLQYASLAFASKGWS